MINRDHFLRQARGKHTQNNQLLKATRRVRFLLRTGCCLQLHQARGGEDHPYRATNGATPP
eukprot:COSAG02_NODE_45470_length_357_cov_0.527132_1_plen_60_part_01